MRPWDVYAKELSTLSRGHAVHNPRRDKFQSGLGLRPAIDVGDVELDGKLIRLFNCLVEQDQQDEDCVFPDDFEVLETARTRSVTQTAPVIVKENHSRPGPLYSKGVEMLKLEAGASIASAAGARIMFSTRHEQGAVLITSGLVKTRQSPNRPAFERYMVKHYDSWCLLLQSQELDVLPEGLMLITGVETTQAWSNLSFSERHLRGEFSVDIPTASPVEVSLAASIEVSRTQSVTRDSGPNPEDMETEDPSHESDPSGEPRVNQVIFVRALRGKKRIFRGLKIVANADPEGFGDEPSSDEDSSGLSVESVDGLAPREDFLTPILDFILENSDVEMAIVHDDDYKAFHHYTTTSSAPRLPADLVCHHRSEDDVGFGVFNCRAVEVGMVVEESEEPIPSPAGIFKLPEEGTQAIASSFETLHIDQDLPTAKQAMIKSLDSQRTHASSSRREPYRAAHFEANPVSSMMVYESHEWESDEPESWEQDSATDTDSPHTPPTIVTKNGLNGTSPLTAKDNMDTYTTIDVDPPPPYLPTSSPKSRRNLVLEQALLADLDVALADPGLVKKSTLAVDATQPPCTKLRIKGQGLLWEACAMSEYNNRSVTVHDVLSALRAFLDHAVSRVEYETLSGEAREAVKRAFARRVGSDNAVRSRGIVRRDFLQGRRIVGLVPSERGGTVTLVLK